MKTTRTSPVQRLASLILFCALSTMVSRAVPIVEKTGTGPATTFSAPVGFAFTLSTAEQLLDLGIYDGANPNSSGTIVGSKGDGLLDDHAVVLFKLDSGPSNPTGTVVAYASFSAGTTGADANGFIYGTPTVVGGGTLTLDAGATYVIETNVTYNGNNAGDYALDNTDHPGTSTDPTLASIASFSYQDDYGSAIYFNGSVDVSDPAQSVMSTYNYGSGAFVGPNLLVTPEPSTWAFLLLGLAVLGVGIRRRRIS